MRIEILVYDNALIFNDEDEIIFKVKRKFKWNSKTLLEFFKGDDLILKTSNYTLFPFFSEKIHFQNLTRTISIHKKNRKEMLFFDDSFIRIKHNPAYLINKKLCGVFLNTELVANVKIRSRRALKKLTLDINFTKTLPKEIKELVLFFIVIKYSDIDGD